MNISPFVKWLLLVSLFANVVCGQENIADKQVLLSVRVVDTDRVAVTDLKKEYFRVFENKKPLEISHFSFENSPLSIGILLDVSPSMGGSLDAARRHILAFLEKGNSANEYFLAAFNKKVDVLSDFAKADVIKDVVRASPYFSKGQGNDSALYDAIFVGMESLSKAKNRKRVLLIFTDGNDNKSSKSYKEVQKLLKEKNVDVYFLNYHDFDVYAGSYSPLQKLEDLLIGSVLYFGNMPKRTPPRIP